MDFIANDRSRAHRGVWHITDNLTEKDMPAREHSYTSPFRGGVTYVTRYPAYTTYHGDAICGQVKNMRQGSLTSTFGYNRKPVDGVVTINERVVRADVILGLDGYIPGPLCSRCAKKAGIEDRL